MQIRTKREQTLEWTPPLSKTAAQAPKSGDNHFAMLSMMMRKMSFVSYWL